MPRVLPSLDLLRGFEAAARLLSFTKAAEELFLTQSAVSRQVQTLEEHLGLQLFDRLYRELRLTTAGHRLYAATTDALNLLMETAASLQRGEGPQAVTVSCAVAFAALWLVPRLTDFREKHPNIDIRISANNKMVDIERERFELAVRYCPVNMVPQGALRLFGEEVFPVCSPELLHRPGKPLISPEDLRHHTLLHYDWADSGFPAGAWGTWLEAMQLRRLRPAGNLQFSHYDQVIQAAVDGQGVALGSSPLVQRHVDQGRLVTPFDQRHASPRAYFLVTSQHGSGRPEVDAFSQWLQRTAAAVGEQSSAPRRGPPSHGRRAATTSPKVK